MSDGEKVPDEVQAAPEAAPEAIEVQYCVTLKSGAQLWPTARHDLPSLAQAWAGALNAGAILRLDDAAVKADEIAAICLSGVEGDQIDESLDEDEGEAPIPARESARLRKPDRFSKYEKR